MSDDDRCSLACSSARDGDESGPINGLFTVSLTQASATDTVLSYTVGGTAVSGADFSPLSGSLTIPANQLSATLTFPVQIGRASCRAGVWSVVLAVVSN